MCACRTRFEAQPGKYVIRSWAERAGSAGATLPPLRTKERRRLSLQARARFVDACRSSFYGSFFGLMVDTGMRPGEACGLRWSDVDFEHGSVNIQRVVTCGEGGRMVLAEPKTAKRRRTIALTLELREELLRHCDWQRHTLHLLTGTPLRSPRR